MPPVLALLLSDRPSRPCISDLCSRTLQTSPCRQHLASRVIPHATLPGCVWTPVLCKCSRWRRLSTHTSPTTCALIHPSHVVVTSLPLSHCWLRLSRPSLVHCLYVVEIFAPLFLGRPPRIPPSLLATHAAHPGSRPPSRALDASLPRCLARSRLAALARALSRTSAAKSSSSSTRPPSVASRRSTKACRNCTRRMATKGWR